MIDMEFKVKLNNSDEVMEFVKAASNCESNIDLQSGSVYLDAKSLLGVMSMGMKREMRVICAKNERKFKKSVSKFAVV